MDTDMNYLELTVALFRGLQDFRRVLSEYKSDITALQEIRWTELEDNPRPNATFILAAIQANYPSLPHINNSSARSFGSPRKTIERISKGGKGGKLPTLSAEKKKI
uniref:Uncharacterized protein n=1 Tax=Megaselia scalaris TaxID=36166 RepID=T1GFQ9_MEGSC